MKTRKRLRKLSRKMSLKMSRKSYNRLRKSILGREGVVMIE